LAHTAASHYISYQAVRFNQFSRIVYVLSWCTTLNISILLYTKASCKPAFNDMQYNTYSS